jgi:hypothetical protein
MSTFSTGAVLALVLIGASTHDARRTTHDARRTTHDARRTTHDARRTMIRR